MEVSFRRLKSKLLQLSLALDGESNERGSAVFDVFIVESRRLLAFD